MPLAVDLRRSSPDGPDSSRSAASEVIGLLMDECQRDPGADMGLAIW